VPKDQPFTDEQLALIDARTNSAARRVLGKYSKAAVVAFAVLVFGNGFAVSALNDARQAVVKSGAVVAVEGCNRDFDTIGVLRAQIVKSKETLKQYLNEGTLTKHQYERAVAETESLLEDYVQPDCRQAQKVITDDPSFSHGAPTPKFVPEKGE
jgi:hypothetical protein